jgi:integrase
MADVLLSRNRMSFASVGAGLDHWEIVSGLGVRERTKQFHQQIIATIKKNFPKLDSAPSDVTEQDILYFGQQVNDFCPSRWNAMVSALRSVTEKAGILKRRKLRFRAFTPPTKAEFARLLEECDKLPRSHAGLVVRFLVLTGLRICEARALRWEHVNCERVYVPSFVSKNGIGRSVPFLTGTAEIAAKLKAVSPDKVLPKNNFRTALEKACERAGIGALSYHCFRHIFATNCIQAGVDVPTVARWLGHQDGGALLARMYFHLIDSHSRSMAEKVRMLI